MGTGGLSSDAKTEGGGDSGQIRPGADLPRSTLLAAADSLSVRLAEFAAGLPDSEKRALTDLVAAAMNPLERMRFLHPSGLLSPDEMRILGGLPHARGRQ